MFRKVIFWAHLIIGLVAGIMIAIMSFTGAALGFEKEIIAWAERDARVITPPPGGSPRLPLDELLQRARAARPEARIANVTVSADPKAAVALGLPNNTTLCIDPYTGAMREAQAPRTRAFMQTMRAWHTRLNFKPTPGQPPLGAELNAAANFAFVFICVSGLILWWPRTWTARVVRPSLWFVRRTRGKARDWNWHNVIGFWTLPALFVMAVTGVVLSYRWAGELVFRIAGETPPTAGARPNPPSNAPRSPRAEAPANPAASAPSITAQAFVDRIARELPRWEQITVRFNPPARENAAAPNGLTAVVRSAGQWPPFSSTNVSIAAGGALQNTDAYDSLSVGTRARRWFRLLHTGEAFRWPGELIATIGCLGACVLVWTGIALAWRRFFGGTKSSRAKA